MTAVLVIEEQSYIVVESETEPTRVVLEEAVTEVTLSEFGVDGALANHLVDTVGAHPASAISFAPTGSIAGADVQTALAEVASEGAAALSAEATTRADADAALTTAVDAVEADLAAEITTRGTADTALGVRVDDEIADRIAGVASEASSRFAADSLLQTSIDVEAGARANADSLEATARADADAAHAAVTTGVHGVGASTVESVAGSAAKVEFHRTTDVHTVAQPPIIGPNGDQAVAGDDSRLTDARIPTGPAGGHLTGTYPNPTLSLDVATQAEFDAHVNSIDAHMADNISFDPSATSLVTTTMQSALTELDADVVAEIAARAAADAAHLADTTNIHGIADTAAVNAAVLKVGAWKGVRSDGGATGLGAIDDNAAIMVAVNAAGANGIVVFEGPEATYLTTPLTANLVGQTWVIPRGVTVKLKDASAQAPVIDITAANVTIEGGGIIDGNIAGQTAITTNLLARSGVRAIGVDRPVVRGMHIKDTVGNGVLLETVTDAVVESNRFTGCCQANANQKVIQVWTASGDSAGIAIRNNKVDCWDQNNGGIAVTCAGVDRLVERVRIQGNEIKVGNAGTTATLGVELFCDNTTAAIKDAVVSGNQILGIYGVATDQVYGISVGGPSSTSLQGDTNFTVTGNTIRNCTAFSVEIIGSGVAVSGNAIYNSGEMLVAANQVTGGIRAVSITGNAFTDCGVTNLAVIALVGSTNGIFGIVISGNSSYDAKAQGIRQTGTVAGASIQGNAFYGTTNAGIALAGTFTDSAITGNLLEMTGAAANSDGIQIANAAITRLLIANNFIRGCTRNGIYGNTASSGIDIRNNTITSCTLHGVNSAVACDRWSVTGNRITGNDRGIIFFPAGTNINVYGNDVYSNPGGNYFLTGSTLVPFNIAGEDVSSGANDSGGAGFQTLRTPN